MGWYSYKKELCVCPEHAENIMIGKSPHAGFRAESRVLRHLTENYAICSNPVPGEHWRLAEREE